MHHTLSEPQDNYAKVTRQKRCSPSINSEMDGTGVSLDQISYDSTG